MNYQYYEKDGKLVITNKLSKVNDVLADYNKFILSSQILKKYYRVQKIRVHYISAQKEFNIDYVDYFEHSTGLELSIFFPFVVNGNYVLKMAQNIYKTSEKYNKNLILKLPFQFYDSLSFACYQIDNIKYNLCSKKLVEDNILELVFTPA